MDIYFVLENYEAEYDKELYFKLIYLISIWDRLSVDEQGHVTYKLTLKNGESETFEKVKNFLTNPKNILRFGIMQSGILDTGGAMLPWPISQPLFWPEYKSIKVQPEEKQNVFMGVWKDLKNIFGSRIVK